MHISKKHCAVILGFAVAAAGAPAFSMPVNAAADHTVLSQDGSLRPSLRNDYLIIEGSAISSTDESWIQPDKYKSYRISVYNSTDEEMTVTVKQPSGINSTFKVPANSYNDPYKAPSLNNNATPKGKYALAFSTKSGTRSGTVSVRVSDVNQS